MYTVGLILALTAGTDAPDFGRGGCCSHGYGGCSYGYGGCSYGYGGCYSYGYAGCYSYGYVGCYSYGGYSAEYTKDASETDEEFDFCKNQAPGKTPSEYADFRGKWLKMTHPDRKKMMGKGKKGGGEGEISTRARLVVTLPADAKLTVDESGTQADGTRREFISPTLTPNRSYSYTLKAEFVRGGKTVTVTKKATVTAGKETLVSFDDAPDRTVASK